MTRVGRGCGPRVTAPVCRTMPSVLLVTVEGGKKKKSSSRVQVMSRTDFKVKVKKSQSMLILNAYLFIFVFVFIYLYRLTQDPSSTVAAGLFEVLLPVIT